MGGRLAVLAWLAVVLCRWSGAREPIHVSVFLPQTGQWPVGRTISSAAALAAEDINFDDTVLAGHTLNVSYHDTGCNQGKALWQLVEEIKTNKRSDVIIGGGCDLVCEAFGLYASQEYMPVISWGCQSLKLSNKQTFPSVARTVGSKKAFLKPVISLLRHFNWKRFNILSSLGESYEWLPQALLDYSENSPDIYVPDMMTSTASNPHVVSDVEHRSHIYEHLMKRAKILLFSASAEEVRNSMVVLGELGKLNGEFAFITFGLSSDSIRGYNRFSAGDAKYVEAMRPFQGILNINIKKPNDNRYKNFEARVRLANSRPPFNYVIDEKEEISVYAGMLYDAIKLYSLALGDAIVLGHKVTDFHLVSSLMFNRRFEGITGDVQINKDGDRLSTYVVQIFKGDRFVDIAEYSPETDSFIMRKGVEIVFPGGKTEVPRDRPECGWENELCSSNMSGIAAGLICAVAAVIIICSVLGRYVYRKMKTEADMKNEVYWRIKPGELKRADDNESASTLNTLKCQNITKQTISYKGMVVHLTKISAGNVFVDRQLLISLRQARELHHENINPFIGLSTNEPFKGIVTSYAARGSLRDILSNTNLNINSDFKVSFMLDICAGMECLHGSPIEYHGHLKSSNCVVDSRWACKVTDFGLRRLRMKESRADGERKYSALLYTAPEILRQANSEESGSRQGDVYSFGIIMHEIVTLKRPYQAVTSEQPKEIVRLVQVGLDPPYRPMLPKDVCLKYMADLMSCCWEEESHQRPNFTSIIKTFKDANEGITLNILDKTSQMMEQYTNHLEDVVQERTKQLEAEKIKTDRLLYQMLPRFIADPLKLGQSVAPKAFEKATVYFSDVVCFTNMASDSTAVEVVNFLNDLYSAFDCIVETHDVYKIETIGDAYVVVSGVPDQNGNKHAGAVASMSLDILSCISTFVIRHMPEKQLQVRIGIHSGPVAAGVVGIKMPRYCLFGETVNIASMMESSGEALQIHISQTTKDILDQIGGYIIEERLDFELKDGDNMKTYWLKSRADSSKALPGLSNLTSASVEDLD